MFDTTCLLNLWNILKYKKMVSRGSRQISSFFVFKVVLLILVVMVMLTLVAHHALSSLAMSDTPLNSHKTRTQLEYFNDPDALKTNPKIMSSLQNEIEELRKIKISVNNELRDLDSKRLKLQSDISSYSMTIDRLKSEQSQLNKEVQHIHLSLEQIKFEQEESKSFIPNIKAPSRILEDLDPMEDLASPVVNNQCRMESCFDFSRCSLVSRFPVYFYDPKSYFINGLDLDPVVEKSFSSFLEESLYRTREANKACIFVVLIGELRSKRTLSVKEVESFLFSLPHWSGDGRNHVLISLGRSQNNYDILQGVNTGRALIAQSFFTHNSFRQNFDMLIPVSLSSTPKDEVWKDLPLLSPVRRKYVMSFWGQYFMGKDSNTNSLSNKNMKMNEGIHKQHLKSNDSYNYNSNRNDNFHPRKNANLGRKHNFELPRRQQRHLLSSVIDSSQFSSLDSFYSHIEQSIVSSIKSFQTNYPDKFHIEASCHSSTSNLIFSSPSIVPSDWLLCPPSNARQERIRQSTFNLIIPPLNNSYYSTIPFQTRVMESIKNGAVPVILGSHGHFPFSEVLHWSTASITLPTPRVTEIPFFLLSIPDEDIAALRLQGRQFYINHFGSVHAILNSILAVIRTRLQIPARPIQEEEYRTAFPSGFVPLKLEGPEPELETDEILGPVESPFPSEAYRHNFTQVSINGDAFNNFGDPFHLYPFTPFHPLLPSEAKFLGSSYGFRPVGGGAGGDGTYFSQSLGGNSPREQFTIVMLTYDREVVLIQALQRFKGLPYLNKVVVVWNNPTPPADDLRWPEIGVPIKVAKTKRNSLNNRFLPYQVIETEAILSIDDDAHLRHDEIVFGFRVWREERTRVVGFPGRFHAWDVKHKSWNYNSNYSCELSMVLTGAAFFHKYYAYQYSYIMPQAIRDKVDEYMNCEDIAMNFLVSHISRKPPVKVTSRWTFRCPGCPTTLSSNSSHFEERHACINFFTEVYGYMPLLYTQYRVDSVLFKTRISHDKTKCFKYI